MGDVGSLDRAGELELSVVRTEGVEQAPALAEQNGDEVEFELVEHAGSQQRLSRSGPVYHDVSPSGRGLRLRHAGLGAVGGEADRARRRGLGWMVREHEDRDAV